MGRSRRLGFIYVIRLCTTEFVKIGFSGWPPSRLYDARIWCPHGIELWSMFPAAMEGEAAIHADLGEYHVRGEWFKFCPAVSKRIKEEQLFWQETIHQFNMIPTLPTYGPEDYYPIGEAQRELFAWILDHQERPRTRTTNKQINQALADQIAAERPYRR